MTEQNANDLLMGGGIPSASFLEIGATIEGNVTEEPTVQQQKEMGSGELKTWPDGTPMNQIVVTIQTEDRRTDIEDDDGRRRLYLKYNLRNAVRDAVKTAGAAGLEVGGRLTVTFSSQEAAKIRGHSPTKFYTAEYIPPANNLLNEADRDEEGEQPKDTRAHLHPEGTSDLQQSQPAATITSETQVITATISKVKMEQNRQGVNIYWIETNEGQFGTRDQEIGDRCKRFEGEECEITYAKNDRGFNVVLDVGIVIPF